MKTLPCRCCGGTGKEIDHRAIGAELRAFRVRCGVSQQQVAKQLKVSAGFLCDLEAGKRNWNEERIQKYREAVTE